MNRTFNKPVVIISKCIEHGHCRYDGSQIGSNFVKSLEQYIDFIPVCPEVEIGLTIPRETIRVIIENNTEKLIHSLSGFDITNLMNDFSSNYIKTLENKRIHGFILKSRSPSCGIKDVKLYKTHGKSNSIGKTSGFFAREIINHFNGLAMEDEGRLTNYNIREHFLTQIFTFSQFDDVINAKTIKALIHFHSINKYLLMAYHQTNQKLLGKIVANFEGKKPENAIAEYYELLKKSFLTPLRTGSNINMLMHLFGYFKNELTKEEKAFFLDQLEQYNTKKIPFSVPISLIFSWVVRFNEPYLIHQTIFRPFPVDILNIADSSKLK